MPKWINVIVSGPLALLNLALYLIYGQAVSIIAFFFIVIVGTIGFVSCLAIEKSFND